MSTAKRHIQLLRLLLSRRHNLHIYRNHNLLRHLRHHRTRDGRTLWNRRNLTIRMRITLTTSTCLSGKTLRDHNHIQLLTQRNRHMHLHRTLGHHFICRLRNLRGRNRQLHIQTHQARRHNTSSSNRLTLQGQWGLRMSLMVTSRIHLDMPSQTHLPGTVQGRYISLRRSILHRRRLRPLGSPRVVLHDLGPMIGQLRQLPTVIL